jgi:rod shape-determining protein MreC
VARPDRSGSRVDIVLLALFGGLALVAVVLPDNIRGNFAGGVRRTALAPLVALQKNAELTRAAFLAHDSQTVVHDSVVMRASSAYGLQVENDRLRKLLGLGRQLQWGFVAAEALHGRGSREEFTVTLTAGASAGVRPFSPVVAPEGLVGMVQTVDPTMSLAILWSHPDFRVSAESADGTAFGIVKAHLGGGSTERYALELSGVPFRSKLAPGTLIVSSGLGGTYPRGIPVGTIDRELQTAETWARTYLVRPAALPSNVTSVMILRPERVTSGVQNVWASIVSADSAARSVAAAGDSLARTAALAEAAARRAALDSTGHARAVDSLAARQALGGPRPATIPRPAPRTDSVPRRIRPRIDSTTPRARPDTAAARPRPTPRVDSAVRRAIPADTVRRPPR